MGGTESGDGGGMGNGRPGEVRHGTVLGFHMSACYVLLERGQLGIRGGGMVGSV